MLRLLIGYLIGTIVTGVLWVRPLRFKNMDLTCENTELKRLLRKLQFICKGCEERCEGSEEKGNPGPENS
jgi:hypothetical protein